MVRRLITFHTTKAVVSLAWYAATEQGTDAASPTSARTAGSREAEAMVQQVVIHEIAHHFEIDDPRLREMECSEVLCVCRLHLANKAGTPSPTVEE